MQSVTMWLKHAKRARLAAKREQKARDRTELLLDLTEKNVVEQLKNLRTHPVVAARLEEGTLKVHGWVYHIGPGTVTTWDEDAKSFVSAEDPGTRQLRPEVKELRRHPTVTQKQRMP